MQIMTDSDPGKPKILRILRIHNNAGNQHKKFNNKKKTRRIERVRRVSRTTPVAKWLSRAMGGSVGTGWLGREIGGQVEMEDK